MCLDLSTIEAGLNTYFIGKSGKNELWDEIASTNDRAIQLAKEGVPEGIMVLARQQTGGRGRQGRRWVSPKDSGIYISFVLRPRLAQKTLPLISFAGAVAAVEAIERASGARIGLKWVNDLVYKGKKLGGILAEMSGSQKNTSKKDESNSFPPALILGFGINLSLADEDVPAELQGKVTCIDQISEKPANANNIVTELCHTLEEQYNQLCHSGHLLVLEEWKKHSQTLGKRIKARVGNEELTGVAEDISSSGALILRLDNGQSRLLHAGEITVRLEDGRYA